MIRCILAISTLGSIASAQESWLPEGETENRIIAVVNNRVVTGRDIQLYWALSLLLKGDEVTQAPAAEIGNLLKELMTFRMWADHLQNIKGTQDPQIIARIDYWMSEGEINRRLALPQFAGISTNPDVDEEMRRALVDFVRQITSKDVALQLDPEYQRLYQVKPEELGQFWELYRDEFYKTPERFKMCRVVLTLELGGGRLAQQIRDRALQLGNLKDAALELAPTSFEEMPWETYAETGLKREIVEFARQAQPGEFSPLIQGTRTVAIYCLEERQEEKTAAFADSIEDMTIRIRRSRLHFKEELYFQFQVLPASHYEFFAGAPGTDPFDRANQRLRSSGQRNTGKGK